MLAIYIACFVSYFICSHILKYASYATEMPRWNANYSLATSYHSIRTLRLPAPNTSANLRAKLEEDMKKKKAKEKASKAKEIPELRCVS